MSNITKNHKVGIFAIFIASALMLGTISVVGIDSAYAGGKKKSNEAEQAIEQPQFNSQFSTCETLSFDKNGQPLGISAVSCNNAGLQADLNTGQDALGQE